VPRTSPSDVQQTFDTDLDVGALADWIQMASDITDDVEADDPSIGDDRLERIERLLAQHFASAQDPRADSLSGASRSVDYGEGRADGGYLKRAIMLDPTGAVRRATEEPDFTLST
jgi:hypothetical protein